MSPEVCAGDWSEVVRAHLSFAARVYTADELRRVAERCGLLLAADGNNSAVSYDDVARYVTAIHEVLGDTAFVSAKLTMMNKARTLGLRPPGVRWFV